MVFTWRNLFLFTVITFHRCFCLFIFLTHVFLHCLRLSKNSRARDNVLLTVNYATLFLTRNASFEICNPRRSWHVMNLSETRRGPGRLSPFVVRSEDPGEALGRNKFWFRITPKWLLQVTNFPTGMSPRSMQYLGSV